jgi:hypothetical protein
LAGNPKILRCLLIVLRGEFYGLLEADDSFFRAADAEEGDAEVVIGAWFVRRFFEGVERFDIASALDIRDA